MRGSFATRSENFHCKYRDAKLQLVNWYSTVCSVLFLLCVTLRCSCTAWWQLSVGSVAVDIGRGSVNVAICSNGASCSLKKARPKHFPTKKKHLVFGRRWFPTCGSGPWRRFLCRVVARVTSCGMAAAGGRRGFEWVAVGPFQLLPSQPLVPSSTPECFFMILAFREVLLCASVYELMTLLCPPKETHCRHSGSGAAKLQYDSDQWLFEVDAVNRLEALFVGR